MTGWFFSVYFHSPIGFTLPAQVFFAFLVSFAFIFGVLRSLFVDLYPFLALFLLRVFGYSEIITC